MNHPTVILNQLGEAAEDIGDALMSGALVS